jgi:hypothetical protein
MALERHGNQDITGVGEIEFWIGRRRRRPDIWECFFVDGCDNSNANCSHLPPDCVTICIEVMPEKQEYNHQEGQFYVCHVSWNVSKPRKIFWRVVHFD